MSRLAEYRKGVITGLSLLLAVLSQVQPFVHGDALQWCQVGIAAFGTALTVLVPNADKPAPTGVNWRGPSNVHPAGPQLFRNRPDVPLTYGDGPPSDPGSVGFPKT